MTFKDLPPLDPPHPAPAPSPTYADADALDNAEFQARLHSLVTAVGQNDGRTYPVEWSPVVGVAVRLEYLREVRGKLFLTKHGQMWLDQRARAPIGRGTTYDMTKIAASSKLNLKAISRDTEVPMQEAIGAIVDALYDYRDELTRVARRAGYSYPWEAIRVLVEGK